MQGGTCFFLFFFLPPSLNFPPGRLTNVRIALAAVVGRGEKEKEETALGGKREGGNGKQTNSRVMRESDEGLWKRKKQLDSNSFSNEGWKNIHPNTRAALWLQAFGCTTFGENIPWRLEENLFGIYNDFVFFFQMDRNHVFFLIALSLISNSHIFLLSSVVLFPVPPMSKLKGKMA